MSGPRRNRPLRALQLEVTSRCTRRCEPCPRTAFADRWLEGDLDHEIWKSLQPDLALVEHLQLQGWGEPLLHPELERMALDAHAAGCEVGITTNADLLLERGQWLAEGEISIVTFSVAGAGEAHSRWRDGASAETVWKAISRLASRRRRRRPRLQVSFLMTSDNVVELPEAVRAAAESGADELFVIHLDCTPTARHLAASAVTEEGLREGTKTAVAEGSGIARRLGLGFRPPRLEPREMVACALDPRQMASLTWDGWVGPCVHLTLPVRGATERVTEHSVLAVEPPRFGRLPGTPLRSLLASRARREFTRPFEHRLAAEKRFREQCTGIGWGAPALGRLDRADRRRAEALASNPMPAACRGCHKAAGW